MKIVILARLFYPETGGIQTYSYELAKNFQALGHEVLVVCPHSDGDEAYDRTAPFEIFRIPGTRMRWIKIIGFILGYFWKARRFAPDLTIATIWAPCGLVAYWGYKLFKVPYALIFHGTEIGIWRKRPLMTTLMQRSIQQSQVTIANSHFTAKQLESLPVEVSKVKVLPCGVDLERFHPNIPPIFKHPERPVLLSIAALVKRKGIDQALRALPEVIKAVPNVLYRIGGTGPELPHLKQLTEELNLQDHVEFLGRLSDEAVPQHMASCNGFVMPSRQIGSDYEGFGIVFLEANACGKVVIAGNTGGIPDAVADGQSGYLVDPEDPQAIAAAMIQLLQDSDAKANLEKQALAHAQQFTWRSIAGQFLTLSLRA